MTSSHQGPNHHRHRERRVRPDRQEPTNPELRGDSIRPSRCYNCSAATAMPLPKHGLLKKIHMYTGLLSFVSFTIFDIAGLNATFRRSPEERRPNDVDVSYVRFQVPAGLSDRQLTDRIYATLRIPLSDPPPVWAVERNRDNNLRMSFYTVNGPRRVIVHEGEDRLEIRKEHQSIWQRFSNLHETTPGCECLRSARAVLGLLHRVLDLVTAADVAIGRVSVAGLPPCASVGPVFAGSGQRLFHRFVRSVEIAYAPAHPRHSSGVRALHVSLVGRVRAERDSDVAPWGLGRTRAHLSARVGGTARESCRPASPGKVSYGRARAAR